MASEYSKNKWELYDPTKPNEQQPHAFITKRKLERIEEGLEDANIPLEIGRVAMSDKYGVSIEFDEENQSRKLNVIFPPAGKGDQGDQGFSAYEVWLQQGNIGTEQDFIDYLKGLDGEDGKDGQNGNKWYYIEEVLAEGQDAPKGIEGDYILDSRSSIFVITKDLKLHYTMNIKDENEYRLEIGSITTGDVPSANITPEGKLSIVFPKTSESNEELKDIRKTVEGKVYPKAGDAVRAQFSELSQKISEVEENVKESITFPIANEEEAVACDSDEVLMTPYKTLLAIQEWGGSGGGGGGGGSTIPIISSEFESGSYSMTDTIQILYNWSSPNVGKGILHVLLNGAEHETQEVKQGMNRYSISNLTKGTHTLELFVTDRGNQYTNTLKFTLRIGSLELTSDFNDSKDFPITQSIKIPIKVDTISLEPIYMKRTIDSETITLSAQSGHNDYILPALSSGAHKVSFQATSGVYESNILTFNIVVEDADNLTLISDFDKTEVAYRDLIDFQYRVSLKGETKFNAEYYIDGNLIRSLVVPKGTNIWSTRELEIGNREVKVVVSSLDGTKTAELVWNIVVTPSAYTPMRPIIDSSLRCWFDATNKSNLEVNKETWEDKSGNETPISLHNINYASNGWIDGALKLSGGGYAIIDLAPLRENAEYGLTVDIKFKTRDVGQQTACVMDMRGSDVNSKGFAIDTQRVYLNSAASKAYDDVLEEKVSRATFVIDRSIGMAKIYNNGVLSEGFLMKDTEDFTNATKICLGATYQNVDGTWTPNIFGDCDIYSIRVYDRALESEEIVTNLIADIADLNEQELKYNLNYNNMTPSMYFYGDTSAMTKDDKVPLRIKYISTDPSKYGDSFDLPECQVSWQGTSSLQYAVKNYKIRLYKDGKKYKYNPYKNGIPESTFCLKADYMESSHANNTGTAKFIHENLYDELTPSQELNPDCRTTINGFPINLYIAKDSTSTPEYIGIFNFNLDKSCTDSLGLDDEVFPECCKFEVAANSDTSAGAFLLDTMESIKEDFEIAYPDEDDLNDEQLDAKYQVLRRMVSWVCNSTEETFKSELHQYFNLEYLIKYFLLAQVNGMIDNLGKNMMLCTWDGLVWYPTFYDLDSQLGLDNTGYKKFYSDIDMVKGTYNTSNSKLFVMLQKCFPNELAEAYKKMRTENRFAVDTFMSYWYDQQVATIGESQYNKDMETKYIAFRNSYLHMMHGRRYESVLKWYTERLLYCDTIYGYEADTKQSITIRANIAATVSLTIHTYSPQYVKVKWKNGVEEKLKICRDTNGNMLPTTFTGTLTTDTDQEIIIYNARHIKKIEGIPGVNPSVLNLVEASRLVEVKSPNSPILSDIRLSENNKFLSYIDLSGCTVLGNSAGGTTSIDLSYLQNITYVNLRDTKLTDVSFPTAGCNLTTLYLPSTILSLHLENMPLLKNGNFLGHTFSYASVFLKGCPLVKPEVIMKDGEPIGICINTSSIHIEDMKFPKAKELVFNVNGRIGGTVPVSGAQEIEKVYLRNVDCTDIEDVRINCANRNTIAEKTASFVIEPSCKFNNLWINKLGLIDKSDIDLSQVNIKGLYVINPSNIKSLNVPEVLEGLWISTDDTNLYKQCYIRSYWISNDEELIETAFKSKDLNDMKLLVNGKGIDEENALDLSKMHITRFLSLNTKEIGSATLLKVNCDFTLGDKYLDKRQDSSNFKYFSLPKKAFIEGNIKSTNTCKTWCSCTSSSFTVMKNFNNLNLDLSAVTDLSFLFDNWKALNELPDSLTPELVNNATDCMNMLSNTALTSIGKLEGMDIVFNHPEIEKVYAPFSYMFNGVKCKFNIGSITYISNGTTTDKWTTYIFGNSGIETIGDVNIKTNGNISDLFANCSNLISTGNVRIENTSRNFYTNRIFSNCPKLNHMDSCEVVLNQGGDISSFFYQCSSMGDFSRVTLPTKCKITSVFDGSGLTNISDIPNYYEVVKTATEANSAFRGCKVTSIPDLEINCNASYIFANNKQLKNVGEIVIKGNRVCDNMFAYDDNLETIAKLDIKDAKENYYLFRSASNLKSINYYDCTKISTKGTNPEWCRLETGVGAGTGKITHLIFQGTVGIYILYDGLIETNPLDLESISSLINCLQSLGYEETLTVHPTTFNLITTDLFAIASNKNWTIASAVL